MKHFYVLFLLMLAYAGSYAQKHDYQWLFGYNNENLPSLDYGGVILNFNDSDATITKHPRIADFIGDNVSYCDDNGNLLFYSNGTDVFDSRDSVMLNGDSINLSHFWLEEIGPEYRYFGLRIMNGLLALPAPADSSQVYLCHYTVNFVSFPDGYADYPSDSTFYSLIDLKGNSGYGAVTKKDKMISNDTLGNCFSAVRHGNGRDWWLVQPYWQGNDCYYQFLLNDTGMGLHNIQCIGPDRQWDGAVGQSCFSPDGSKYFWVNAGDGIRMFDFDRCSGLLSNPQIIPFPDSTFGIDMVDVGGIAVSPSNQYLYVVGADILLQYDLLATDIGVSVDTVGIFDGTFDPNYPFAADFYLAQLGPDGKIYISSTNGIPHLHVINQPDNHGDSCMFVQRGLYLETENASSMPNFPNYRLGPLKGSPCDTLNKTDTLGVDIFSLKESILKIFPNPSTDYTVIDYGFTDWSKGGVSLTICNELGQTVYQQRLPMYSGYQKIDISPFASGLYMAFIKRSDQMVAVAKFVKQ